MNFQKRIAALVSATLLFSLPGSSSQSLDEALNAVTAAPETEETATETPEPEPTEPRWMGRGFSLTEAEVLDFLQDRGITDRAALATILGNIKQESKFDTIICEGGRRTGYHGCHRGGFGLIQFTSAHRYLGLGKYARDHQMDPDAIETQIQYVFTEREWKAAERGFMQEGKSVGFYMNHAYTWLGWGIHGSRTHYSNQYAKHLR